MATLGPQSCMTTTLGRTLAQGPEWPPWILYFLTPGFPHSFMFSVWSPQAFVLVLGPQDRPGLRHMHRIEEQFQGDPPAGKSVPHSSGNSRLFLLTVVTAILSWVTLQPVRGESDRNPQTTPDLRCHHFMSPVPHSLGWPSCTRRNNLRRVPCMPPCQVLLYSITESKIAYQNKIFFQKSSLSI